MQNDKNLNPVKNAALALRISKA